MMRRPVPPPPPIEVKLPAGHRAKAAEEAAKEGKTLEQWLADLAAAELRRRGVATFGE